MASSNQPIIRTVLLLFIASTSLASVNAFSLTCCVHPVQSKTRANGSSLLRSASTDVDAEMKLQSAAASESKPTPASPKASSRALQSILHQSHDGAALTIPEFFSSIWQQSPALFPSKTHIHTQTENRNYISSGIWNHDHMKSHPYEELVQESWQVLTDLLEQPIMSRNPDNPNEQSDPPLVIHSGIIRHPQEWMPAYGTTSLFAPYLNGSSVVQAHADCLSPWLAAFCGDFQLTFPYVYANTYLTPPHSRALNLHADDRDVFVVQLIGSKEWEVMKEVPVSFPYPHEQVGKGELRVPQHVVDGESSLKATLKAGDVLYIPRGHCHHAKCTNDLSFHVTIAIATFDWSLAGILHMASKSVLMNVDDYRKSLLPLEALDEHNPHQALQDKINSAIELLRTSITPESVLGNLNARIETHRERAKVQRERQFKRAESMVSASSSIAVGPLAAKHVSLSTNLRASTAEELQQLQEILRRAPRKLRVRDEIAKDASTILTILQDDATKVSSVFELRSLLSSGSDPSPVWCDLAWLGFAKLAVESGELAVAD